MTIFWRIIHWAERSWIRWTREYEYPLIRLAVAAFALSFSLTLGFFFAFLLATKVLGLVTKFLSL